MPTKTNRYYVGIPSGVRLGFPHSPPSRRRSLSFEFQLSREPWYMDRKWLLFLGVANYAGIRHQASGFPRFTEWRLLPRRHLKRLPLLLLDTNVSHGYAPRQLVFKNSPAAALQTSISSPIYIWEGSWVCLPFLKIFHVSFPASPTTQLAVLCLA